MSNTPDLFSAAGIVTWQRRLNASTAFADASAGWNGSLVLIESRDGDSDGRRTWIVVDDGRCREARVATGGDEERADFVLSAAPATWDDLVHARTTPAMAAMTARLRLAKGDLIRLAPHARAAAALLAAAAQGTID